MDGNATILVFNLVTGRMAARGATLGEALTNLELHDPQASITGMWAAVAWPGRNMPATCAEAVNLVLDHMAELAAVGGGAALNCMEWLDSVHRWREHVQARMTALPV